MKTKVLTTIVSAFVATVTFADDTIHSLSDRMLMLEERTTSNEKKIKQLSSAQSKTTKSLNETKGRVEQLRHDQVRLELEQLRANQVQLKIYTPQQIAVPFTYNSVPEHKNTMYTEVYINAVLQKIPFAHPSGHTEFVISPYTDRLVSVKGIPAGQLVKDPLSGKIFMNL